MPYPVHAMQLGEAMTRDFLGPDYDVYSVSYHNRGLPYITKLRIRTGTANYPLKSYPNSMFVLNSYYEKGSPLNWSSNTSLGDRNMPINKYNDYYLFIEWHRAVQYMIQCYEDSFAKSPENLEKMVKQAQEVQPNDGKVYVFSCERPQPKPVNEGMKLGDILEAALKRRPQPKPDYFGARGGNF